MKAVLVAVTLGAAVVVADPALSLAAPAPPAGDYRLDINHTSVNFRISHLGFSHYTARFTRIDGRLKFDPDHPANQSVEATIDANSIQTNYVGPPKLDFDAQVGREFLHAAEHPQITFRSTKVDVTGANTARVTGDLTLNGVTRPVTLETKFNGGWPRNAMDGARIGFSAHGAFRRSDFGITYGLPAPGTNLGVGDEIEVIIETEFSAK